MSSNTVLSSVRKTCLSCRFWEKLPRAHAMVAAVAHREFARRPLGDFAAKIAPGGLYVDVKSQADAAAFNAHGVRVWRL